MTIEMPRSAQLLGLRTLWKEAFGDDDAFLDTFFDTAYAPDRCRLITVGGQVAAALYWFDGSVGDNRIAYLYAIATAKAYRGQGLCQKLMDDTHALLRDRGYIGAVLVPGDESLFGFYRRMGYETCSRIGEYRCLAAEQPTTVRRIGRDEYAHMRRALLPSGGVIQEAENLAFLETVATLYAGDGFVMAARISGTTLHGVEWLGDTASAAAVVTALGCRNGVFRVPTDEKPFAMYRPLDGGHAASPSYFGLAFD